MWNVLTILKSEFVFSCSFASSRLNIWDSKESIFARRLFSTSIFSNLTFWSRFSISDFFKRVYNFKQQELSTVQRQPIHSTCTMYMYLHTVSILNKYQQSNIKILFPCNFFSIIINMYWNFFFHYNQYVLKMLLFDNLASKILSWLCIMVTTIWLICTILFDDYKPPFHKVGLFYWPTANFLLLSFQHHLFWTADVEPKKVRADDEWSNTHTCVLDFSSFSFGEEVLISFRL